MSFCNIKHKLGYLTYAIFLFFVKFQKVKLAICLRGIVYHGMNLLGAVFIKALKDRKLAFTVI